MIDREQFAALAASLGGTVAVNEYDTPVLSFTHAGRAITVMPRGLRDSPETVMHISTAVEMRHQSLLLRPSTPKRHQLRVWVDRPSLTGDMAFDGAVEPNIGVPDRGVLRLLLGDARTRAAIQELFGLGHGLVSLNHHGVTAIWNQRDVSEAMNAELIEKTAEQLCALCAGLPAEIPPLRRESEWFWPAASMTSITVPPIVMSKLPMSLWIGPLVCGVVVAAAVGTQRYLRGRLREEPLNEVMGPTLLAWASVTMLLTLVAWFLA
jgi:hypothetical protein